MYFIGVKLEGKFPFILNVDPYIIPGFRPSPSQALINLVSNPLEEIPLADLSSVTIVAVSAFSTKETFEFYFNHKIKFIHSLNRYPSTPINNLKRFTKEYRDWNIVYNPQTHLATFLMIGTSSKKVKLFSNAFEISCEEEGNPTILTFYKKHFNKIDLFNKCFYYFRSKNRHYKWKQVFLDDIISLCLTNSLALFNSSNGRSVRKKTWARMVASAIFNSLK